MNSFLHALTGRIDITPGRLSAFGAAIGGLFALMVVNVFGAPSPHGAAALTASDVTTLSVGGGFVVASQMVGALIAWARANRPD